MTEPGRRRLAVIASHVIQYQDPFFNLLARQEDIDLTVLYCSRKGAESYLDQEMGTTLQWDLNMLQGYRYHFFRNVGATGSEGYGRAINPGLVGHLLTHRYDAVLFMAGWGTITSLAALLACRAAQLPILLFGDSSFPAPEDRVASVLRAGVLRSLFGMASAFMISGTLNGSYYRHYGADPTRFFPLPWSIDNDRFAERSRLSMAERQAMRASFGIESDCMLVVFSAKMIPRKDPMTLLRALARMQHRQNSAVLFLGDGVLREQISGFARAQGLNVHFAGFVNQLDLPRYYAAGDVFVLPSKAEPRGSVTNEAMACGLPVVVSDQNGAIEDIVRHGDNGFVFPVGDDDTLAVQLDMLASDPSLRQSMGNRSREIIAGWDFNAGVRGVSQALRWLESQGGAP